MAPSLCMQISHKSSLNKNKHCSQARQDRASKCVCLLWSTTHTQGDEIWTMLLSMCMHYSKAGSHFLKVCVVFFNPPHSQDDKIWMMLLSMCITCVLYTKKRWAWLMRILNSWNLFPPKFVRGQSTKTVSLTLKLALYSIQRLSIWNNYEVLDL